MSENQQYLNKRSRVFLLHQNKRYWFAGIMSILFCAAQYVAASEIVLVPQITPIKKAPTEILIKYKPGAHQLSQLPQGTSLTKFKIEQQSIPAGETTESWIQKNKNQGVVQWVEPNYWRYALATEVVPNDPYYRPERNQRQFQQWHLPKINANFAWSLAQGKDDLIVAVLDSGVDLNHPELKDRLLPGVSLVHQANYTPPANGMDDHGHGTSIAGIIAASTDNNIGISGCAWQGKILPVKVLNNKGEGLDSDIAQGIVWAADAGAKIINLSLGGASDDGQVPQTLQAAVDYAYSQGCLLIAASGNSGDRTVNYPAALNHVIAVAATDPWDQRASYSTYGSYVDLAAPGGAGGADFSKATGIMTTYWNENSRITDFSGGAEAGEYAISAGTSNATAVVSGTALVVWGYYPNLNNDQLENTLKTTAVDVGATGADEETGAGRVDMLAALGNPAVIVPNLTLYNYPNPFNPERDGQTQIVFRLDRPTSMEVKLYDSARELVWSCSVSEAETLSGKNYIVWDGKNSKGEQVANGVYFYRLTAADGAASQIKTIAVLR